MNRNVLTSIARLQSEGLTARGQKQNHKEDYAEAA